MSDETMTSTESSTVKTGDQRVAPAAQTAGPNDRCCKRLFGSGRGFRGSQCAGKPKVFDGGKWYCTIHSPEKVAARREKSNEKYEADAAINVAVFRLHTAAPDLLALARQVACEFADAKHPGSMETRLRDLALAAIAIAKAEGRGSPVANSPSNEKAIVP